MKDIFFKIKNEAFRNTELKAKPLALVLLEEGVVRAWWKETPNENGLELGEFMLSPSEYAKFGLKQNQQKRISRAVSWLVATGYRLDTGKVATDTGAKIYRLLPNDLVIPVWVATKGRPNGDQGATPNKEIYIENSIDNKDKREREALSVNIFDENICKYTKTFRTFIENCGTCLTGTEQEDMKKMQVILSNKHERELSLLTKKLSIEDTEESKVKGLISVTCELIKQRSFRRNVLSSVSAVEENLAKIVNAIGTEIF